MNEFRLAMSVTHADGRVTRWGPGEASGEDIPNDLGFSTSIPGGFRDLTCSLLRLIDRTYADEALFDAVRAYTAGGGSSAWEGRIAQLPRQHGDSYGVTPGAVGWAAHLRDDPSFREIYRDIDLTRWEDPSVQRRINLASVGVSALGSASARPDDATGEPGLMQTFSGPTSARARIESYYDGGGIDLGFVSYAAKVNAFINTADTNWAAFVGLATNDVLGATNPSVNLISSMPVGPATLTASGAAKRYAYLLLDYLTSIATAGRNYDLFWTHLAVHGTHGLTLRGVEPDAGYYVSDLVDDVVKRTAPMLTRNGIETNTSVIPHVVYSDPVTGEDAISRLNAYTLWEWGVWEDRDFFFRPPDLERCCWRARLDGGARVELEGDSAEHVFNGVLVSYQDAAGKRRTVGPPGARADDTAAVLADTRPANPVNAHGIPRRWARLEVSVPTTLAGATLIGQVYLAERLMASRRGTITLTGTATHPTKGKRPVWEIRAGDSVLIEDRNGDVARRIIQTDYRHAERTNSLACDNTSAKLDAILERLGVGLIGRF